MSDLPFRIPSNWKIEHILVFCKGLNETRARVLKMWDQKLKDYRPIKNIVNVIMKSSEVAIVVQFLLDCSVVPAIIDIAQSNSEVLELLFHLTRTWCHSVNIDRLKKLGRYHKWLYCTYLLYFIVLFFFIFYIVFFCWKIFKGRSEINRIENRKELVQTSLDGFR